MQTHQDLLDKRRQIDLLRYKDPYALSRNNVIEQSILNSWQRSESAIIPHDLLAAPISTKYDDDTQTTLTSALKFCGEELRHIAEQSSMVVAVGDIGSTIVWSAASKSMREAAQKVNFVEGGQWQEELVGTNALALSIKNRRSCCVFSNEHYMPSIQEWVCYAAPIIDPHNKNILGVIDLSTTWEKHNSLGILAAERCALMIQNAIQEYRTSHLYIQAFANPQVFLNGKELLITPRQVEIITILALHPHGLNLDNLHQLLYGERNIGLGTLKAEMSQLRRILGDGLDSRPYTLCLKVEGDFLQVEQALDNGYFVSALQLYTGTFLAKTESPFLYAWRNSLESRLSNILYQTKESDLLMKHLARFPEAIDALKRLMELLPNEHPAHHLLSEYEN